MTFIFYTDSEITDTLDTITMYYRYSDKTLMNFLFYINDNLTEKNNYYGGVQNFIMCDINGINNQTMISFTGTETKASDYQSIPFTPDIFHRKITIRINYDKIESETYDFICAFIVYNNTGTGDGKTVLSFVTYYISVATGIFEGYKTVTIYFDNVNNTRTIKINK